MEPRIQYAITADKVSIAHATSGEGYPVVYLAGWPFENIGLEWQQPDYQLVFGRIIETHRLVRFDGRGTGLSQRDCPEFSQSARLLDLEAVVDHLRLERFAMVGFSTSGPLAIEYAAKHPERVSHLILYDTFANAAELTRTPQMMAFDALMRADWDMFTETLSNVGYGWSAGEPARKFAAFLRACVTQATAIAAMDHMRSLDVSPFLDEIRARTLVLQHADLPFPGMDTARDLASGIRDARLTVLEGNYGRAVAAEREPMMAFLESTPDSAVQPDGLMTILFTDIENSTAMTQRIGDARAQELVRSHNEIVRDALRLNRGREIKHTGDGIMASFRSASAALDCAIAVQHAFAQHNESAPIPLRVRIGLNAGEPVAEDRDLFGTAVQLAARVCDRADAGQVLVSDVVRQLVAGKGFLFADRGDVVLRGFEDPARLYELRWE